MDGNNSMVRVIGVNKLEGCGCRLIGGRLQQLNERYPKEHIWCSKGKIYIIVLLASHQGICLEGYGGILT